MVTILTSDKARDKNDDLHCSKRRRWIQGWILWWRNIVPGSALGSFTLQVSLCPLFLLYGFEHCSDINAHCCDTVLFCPVRHISPLFDPPGLESFPFAVLARAGPRDGDPRVVQTSRSMTVVSGAE